METTVDTSLGMAIRLAHVSRHMRQCDLAQAAIVSPEYVSLLERDRVVPMWVRAHVMRYLGMIEKWLEHAATQITRN